jgi:hypothetical protein
MIAAGSSIAVALDGRTVTARVPERGTHQFTADDFSSTASARRGTEASPAVARAEGATGTSTQRRRTSAPQQRRGKGSPPPAGPSNALVVAIPAAIVVAVVAVLLLRRKRTPARRRRSRDRDA